MTAYHQHQLASRILILRLHNWSLGQRRDVFLQDLTPRTPCNLAFKRRFAIMPSKPA